MKLSGEPVQLEGLAAALPAAGLLLRPAQPSGRLFHRAAGEVVPPVIAPMAHQLTCSPIGLVKEIRSHGSGKSFPIPVAFFRKSCLFN